MKRKQNALCTVERRQQRGTVRTLCIALLAGMILTISGCTKKTTDENRVLMLIVDYTTNRFEGGKEISYNRSSDSFTITKEYVSPGDFGHIKLFYSEIDTLLFYGTIIWSGCGEILYPENLLSAEGFDTIANYITPVPAFETIYHYEQDSLYYPYTYDTVWQAVQNLQKVQEYLLIKPQKVKAYFYAPSVGIGDPADWKWIFFLHRKQSSTVYE